MNPIPLRPDYRALERDWHRGFIHAATANVLSQIQKNATAGEILRQQWPDDSRAAVLLRGATEPLKQSAIPGNAVTRLLLLAPQSAAAQLFESAIKIDLSGIASFSFPLPTSFSEAAFVEEGMPINVGMGAFDGMPLGPIRKLALIAALSNEIERASGDIASTIIEHCLKIAVGNGLAKVLFSADAEIPDIAPPGLLHGVTAIAGSASMSQDLAALVGSISAAGIDPESVVFVAAAEQATAIKLTAGPLFNHRVIGANLTAGTVIAIAVAGLVVAGSGVPTIDTSRQALLHFADPASPISTAGAPNVVSAPTLSVFQADMIALRCIARITWAAAPGSVSVATGCTW